VSEMERRESRQSAPRKKVDKSNPNPFREEGTPAPSFLANVKPKLKGKRKEKEREEYCAVHAARFRRVEKKKGGGEKKKKRAWK